MNETLMNSDQPVQQEPQNYLTELVGEGKKFKTPEDLAKGKYEADNHIKTVERELAQLRNEYSTLRDDYQARAKLEELIDQLQAPQQHQPTQQQPQQVVPQQQPTIDSKQIESLVSNKILEYESSKVQQQNFNFIKSKLQERFGTNYPAALKQQTEELGLTEDFVNDLARKHPQVLLKTLGMDAAPQKQNFQSPPKSEQRSDNFAPSNQKRTWSYYQNLKRTDPKAYSDPQTQVQLHDDAIKYGDDFMDGDFHKM